MRSKNEAENATLALGLLSGLPPVRTSGDWLTAAPADSRLPKVSGHSSAQESKGVEGVDTYIFLKFCCHFFKSYMVDSFNPKESKGVEKTNFQNRSQPLFMPIPSLGELRCCWQDFGAVQDFGVGLQLPSCLPLFAAVETRLRAAVCQNFQPLETLAVDLRLWRCQLLFFNTIP
jgi:hypothetical protein